MSINEVQNEIISEFEMFDDWMDRYQMIIEMGNDLPEMDEREKTPDNLIEGCQSRVWITSQVDSNGLMSFNAASDAVIVKGIISMLLRVLNHRTPKEIIDADLYFIDKVGLKEHLSPTRSNGLVAMVQRIKVHAIAAQNK